MYATRTLAAVLVGLIAGLCSTISSAQTLPDKAIRVIVPLVPGASLDARMRIIAAAMSDRLKRHVVVENKPGAGGSIGTALVAQAAPDGTTLLFTNNSYAISPYALKNPGYDPVKSLTPVNRGYISSLVVVATPTIKAQSMKELVALAKSQPNLLSYGSSGMGSLPHFAAEAFFNGAGISPLHVPFKGDTQALTEVMAGRVSLVFSGILAAQPHIKAGKLRALAVTSPARLAALDGVPTMREAGYPEYNDTIWTGFFAPAGTPRPVIELLNREITATLNDPSLRAKLDASGAEAAPMPHGEFAKFIQTELARYAKLVKALGIRMD